MATATGTDPHAYALRPVEFAEEVLHLTTLTADQKRILKALHESPYRVLVPAAHDTGKTFCAAVAALYWYYSFDPGLVLTTAPTEKAVVDLLWAEIRTLARRGNLDPPFIGPRAPEVYHHGRHYAKGYVSQKNVPFQGRHSPRKLFLFDEANEIEALHWVTARTMVDPEQGDAWVSIFNPTTTTSQAYVESMLEAHEDGTPRWNQMRLSALDHPNVLADLRGEPRPVPGAVNLAMVNENLADWAEPIHHLEDVTRTDIEWPPGSGRHYRPGPLFQARVMGLWPDAGNGVWSPALWEACFPLVEPAIPLTTLPEIGVDCSMGKGEDYFALHCRWGAVSLYHETSNTMDPPRILGRVKAACARMAGEVGAALPSGQKRCDPRRVRVRIDDDGTGNAVAAFLKRDGYSTQLVSAGSQAQRPDLYPFMRHQAWFNLADMARAGLVCFNRLDVKTLRRLRQQLLAPVWDVDGMGRRVVEKKDDTKEKIGRSPDDADAMNLAYYEGGVWAPPEVLR